MDVGLVTGVMVCGGIFSAVSVSVTLKTVECSAFPVGATFPSIKMVALNHNSNAAT